MFLLKCCLSVAVVTANALFTNESSFCVQPVYFTFLVPHDANKEKMGGGEAEDGAAAEQKGGEAEADGGSGGSHGNKRDRAAATAGAEGVLPLQFQTYKEAARKYYLQHTDNNMVGGPPTRASTSLKGLASRKHVIHLINQCHMTFR